MSRQETVFIKTTCPVCGNKYDREIGIRCLNEMTIKLKVTCPGCMKLNDYIDKAEGEGK